MGYSVFGFPIPLGGRGLFYFKPSARFGFLALVTGVIILGVVILIGHKIQQEVYQLPYPV